jgi:hypothetical protein
VMKLTRHNVVMEAHRLCRPVKLTPDCKKDVTLPDRIAGMYLDMHGEWKLPPLDGISTAPLLSADGSIRGIAPADVELAKEALPTLSH